MTPKRRSSDKVLTGGRIVAVGAICAALLTIFTFAENVNTYYKEKEIKPMVERMIDKAVGPLTADNRTIYLYLMPTDEDDSIAHRKWNQAVRTVNRLFPEHAVGDR